MCTDLQVVMRILDGMNYFMEMQFLFVEWAHLIEDDLPADRLEVRLVAWRQ